MKFLRFFLFPFSLIYGFIAWLRNGMYSIKWFRSTKFSVPIINVGNLSMGGTGKTPHVEYLIRLLKGEHKVATLSRGFGRKTVGFRLASDEDTAKTIGDEPYQYFNKFGSSIQVAVESKRVLGVVDIMRNHPDTNVIILDDAFQHRSITAGLNILLTTYDTPFSSDFILPLGNLREFRNGKERADIVVVTKCPDLDQSKEDWRKKLKLNTQVPLFFSAIRYAEMIPITTIKPDFDSIILVTGIATSYSLVEQLQKEYALLHHFKFKDHHRFTEQDLKTIHNLFNKFAKGKKVAIVTTEKDAMRLLEPLNYKQIELFPWYYKEIKIELNEEEKFNTLVNNYVQKIN